MLEDELLEKYGEFYCSRYVAKNQPWILQIPFGEWVERQLAERRARLASPERLDPQWEALVLYPEEDYSLPETA
ncbi:hypothetical protein [Gorillibacterium sp. sgz500922]|uniref:hypothetical protein n=1 Tax=Gorillibacterium sp. sgz500922 TaxID=3446694 RepID=UPI003F664CA3